MTAPRVLTIIVNYRTAQMTLRAAAAALEAMAGGDELIIVDNASNDGSFAVMEAHARAAGWLERGRVRLLQSKHNGGYGAGNNIGIRAGMSDGTRPDYLYLLNSDAFPDRGAIRALSAHLEAEPAAGLAGSYIHDHQGAHVTCFRFPSVLSEFEGAIHLGPVTRLLRDKKVPMGVQQRNCRVDWLAGASLMIRQSTLDRIGLFDERFFLYFEETDLCLRAARAGIATVYVRDSQVLHLGSVSTGMKTWEEVPDYWFQSRWHYFSKNHGRLYAALASLAHLTGGGLDRLRRFLGRRAQVLSPRFLGKMLRHDLAAVLGGESPPRGAAPATRRCEGE